MAIISEIPGIEVTIMAGNHVAREYNDPDPEPRNPNWRGPKTVLKYIKSRDGAAISINVRVTNKYDWDGTPAITFAFYIDGTWVRGAICRQVELAYGSWETEVTHRVLSNEYVSAGFFDQSFLFGDIEEVEGNSREVIVKDRKRARKMGTIDVKVYRAVEKGKKSIFRPISVQTDDSDDRTIKMSKEALRDRDLTHGVEFTPAIRTTKPTYVSTKRVAKDTGPLAMFRFVYRSEVYLKDEGIMPSRIIPAQRPRALAPSPESRFGETFQQDEASHQGEARESASHNDDGQDGRRAPAVKKEVKKEIKKEIKKEVKQEIKQEAKGIKREVKKEEDDGASAGPSRAAKRVKTQSKVVIDLEDD
ncbi:hypothetical protein F4778DRAFT_777495 [Xylariomycetidae sp. FL2044]|nr:hypothetical protein F4778DRAFT_777495 [Xylariomycetidae sp. FL2044]